MRQINRGGMIMSKGDILSALADKGTLDLTKADTTAIRNTLGNFPGGVLRIL